MLKYDIFNAIGCEREKREKMAKGLYCMSMYAKVGSHFFTSNENIMHDVHYQGQATADPLVY